jgi:hypothetical protein
VGEKQVFLLYVPALLVVGIDLEIPCSKDKGMGRQILNSVVAGIFYIYFALDFLVNVIFVILKY